MSALEILQKLISYPTITPKECGIYEYICSLLPSFEAFRFDCEDTKNLFLLKRSSNPNAKHLCFAGHIDVVPAGEGWESDPFVPTLKDGYLYGRGAQDMKGGVTAFLSALREATPDDLTLSVLLTSDEEGDGTYGTHFALAELEKMALLPEYCIVAEPTSEKKIADMIKIGRRGSINGVLKILGEQGHAAYPSKCKNPTELLGNKLGEIAGKNLDNGDEFFEPSKIVITDIRGGMEVCNVTPSELRIMFNVRNSTLTSKKDIEDYLAKLLADIPHTLELKESSLPFMTSSDSLLIKTLASSVRECKGYEPTLGSTGGTSDARFFAQYGVEVAELGVLNDRIHAKNENVSLEDLQDLVKIFKNFILSFSKER